ncbi:hypothetical protein EAX62_01790 [Tessaracoccus antarcticus]|uniref:Uncharacterized protein n=2 Tax=Tessaracoccus antarcticus TaxID=2479848 RepID=A0A3M0GIH6_9ACTN|nr:hypothetical protein EAX62_01790 [Tessaracoccus antarcticus]
MAAVAGVLILLVGCTTPDPPAPSQEVTSPAITSTPASPPAGSATPSDVEEMDWGPFPPKNLDAPKDLSDPQFPQTVLTFELDSESGDAASRDVFYADRAAGVSMLASITLGRESYRGAVELLADPAYQGQAVCGHPTATPDQIECVMVGAEHVLTVGTAAESSLQDVAAFAEAIYAVL